MVVDKNPQVIPSPPTTSNLCTPNQEKECPGSKRYSSNNLLEMKEISLKIRNWHTFTYILINGGLKNFINNPHTRLSTIQKEVLMPLQVPGPINRFKRRYLLCPLPKEKKAIQMIFKQSRASMIDTSSVLFASFVIFAALKSGDTKARLRSLPVNMFFHVYSTLPIDGPRYGAADSNWCNQQRFAP
jgi:hypothetical protein